MNIEGLRSLIYVLKKGNGLGRTKILVDRYAFSSPWGEQFSVSIVPMVSLAPCRITSCFTREPYRIRIHASEFVIEI